MSQKEKPKIDPSSLKKILLIRLRRIGDIVMTTPAIAALRHGLPGATIDYVVEAPFSRLVDGHPDLDRVFVVPRKEGAADFMGFIRRIRREKFDAVLDFHGGPRAARIAWFSGAKLKIGYELKGKRFLYNIRVPRRPKDGFIHSVENHLNLVRALGISVPDPAPPLRLPEPRAEETGNIDHWWEGNGLGRDATAVLHIGAGNRFRDWGAENLSALIRHLVRRSGAKVILVGSEDDMPRAEALRTEDPASILSLVGKINLIELRLLIARARLFVGPDSGPMHIAATTGTPIVALFGPTLPANFAPWKAEATLLEKPLACRPCRQRRCVSQDFRCLLTITPEEVYAACERYLGRPGTLESPAAFG